MPFKKVNVYKSLKHINSPSPEILPSQYPRANSMNNIFKPKKKQNGNLRFQLEWKLQKFQQIRKQQSHQIIYNNLYKDQLNQLLEVIMQTSNLLTELKIHVDKLYDTTGQLIGKNNHLLACLFDRDNNLLSSSEIVNKCRCKIIVEEGLDKYEIDGMNFDFFEDFEQLNEKIQIEIKRQLAINQKYSFSNFLSGKKKSKTIVLQSYHLQNSKSISTKFTVSTHENVFDTQIYFQNETHENHQKYK